MTSKSLVSLRIATPLLPAPLESVDPCWSSSMTHLLQHQHPWSELGLILFNFSCGLSGAGNWFFFKGHRFWLEMEYDCDSMQPQKIPCDCSPRATDTCFHPLWDSPPPCPAGPNSVVYPRQGKELEIPPPAEQCRHSTSLVLRECISRAQHPGNQPPKGIKTPDKSVFE